MFDEARKWANHEIVEGFPVLKERPTLPLAIVFVGLLVGGTLSYAFSQHQISVAYVDRDIARNCRQSGSELPACPVIRDGRVQWRTKTEIKQVPTPDPTQAAEIDRLGRELKAAKLAASHTPATEGRQAMVTGNGSSADLNTEIGTDRPMVSGNNTHATGNTVLVTPLPPSVLQQLQNQQKIVLQEILQQYFSEHPDANGQVAVPVDYINSELKKRNLDWYVTIPPGVPYTVHSPQNQNESAIFAR